MDIDLAFLKNFSVSVKATSQQEGTFEITMTSEEVATLVDLCYAAAASDLISRRRESQQRVNRFLDDVHCNLFDGAQQFWQQRSCSRAANAGA